MRELGLALSAIAEFGPLGIALAAVLLMSLGLVLSLVLAWRRGYFRSHTDLVRDGARVRKTIEGLRQEIASLQERVLAEYRKLEERVDVLAVNHAGLEPAIRQMHEAVSEVQRTMKRLDRELSRLSGAYEAIMSKPATPYRLRGDDGDSADQRADPVERE